MAKALPKSMALCDGVRENKTEAGVFHLRSVRQGVRAGSLPFAPSRLWLFLVLTSQRLGVYPGYVRVINDRTDKTIFYAKLVPTPRFEPGNEFLAGRTRISCSHPEPGRYTVQDWFFQEQGTDVLKGEMSLSVTSEGD